MSRQKESINQELARVRLQTVTTNNEVEREVVASQLALSLVKIANQVKELEEQKGLEASRQELEDSKMSARLALSKKEFDFTIGNSKQSQALRLELLTAESAALVERFKAITGGDFTQALMALSNNEVLVKVAEAMNLQRAIGGDNVVDSFNKIFSGTPLEGAVKKILGSQATVTVPVTSNGKPASAM